MDWVMKFLFFQYREIQLDFFGKKGISWYILCLIIKKSDFELIVSILLDYFDLNIYIYIFENGI